MGIRIYSNSFSNPEYYLYSYSLKVDLTNNIRIRIRVKISIRDNTDIYVEKMRKELLSFQSPREDDGTGRANLL